jgi:hypothetical protein
MKKLAKNDFSRLAGKVTTQLRAAKSSKALDL